MDRPLSIFSLRVVHIQAVDHHLSRLRARARIHRSLGKVGEALADIGEVCSGQLGKDGGMSLKTDHLVADEAFRDEMMARLEP